MRADPDLLREIGSLRAQLHDLERRLGTARPAAVPDGPFDVLLSRVGDELVAFPLSWVEEVVAVAAMTPVPEAPPWLCGLLRVGEEVLPVLDVLGRIARRARTFALRDVVLVCNGGGRRVGLLVQDVLTVARVDPAELRDPTSEHLPQGPYLAGAFARPEGLALLFDVECLLSTSELPEIDAAEAPGGEDG